MTETGPNADAMLAGLRDIRLPAEAAGGWPAEMAAAVALAGLAALLVGLVFRLLSLRQSTPRERSLKEDIADLAALPADERRIALLHILKARAPDRFATLRDSLYKPGEALDVARLQAEVERLG